MNDNNSICTNKTNLYEKPKILLIGMRRSGKTSIRKVVFEKAAPNETLNLESTHKIEINDISSCSFIQFDLMDLPGQGTFATNILSSPDILNSSCALIFVIDAQDDYIEALKMLNDAIATAYRLNHRIKFEVFIHKVDSLSEENKIDTQRDIAQRVNSVNEELLYDAQTLGNIMNQGISIGFHLTTIYDHSIFEAFSKVVQKLIPFLDAFENLLNIFISSSSIEKAFLFDVTSKIYLATDTYSNDMQIYEQCCDMIDVIVDISTIYSRPCEDDKNTNTSTSATAAGKITGSDAPRHFSENTQSIITLNNETVLYFRGVNQYMALVCQMKEEALDKIGIIDYNFQVVKNSLQRMLRVNEDQINKDTKSIIENFENQAMISS